MAGDGARGSAVTATRPPRAPFSAIVRSTFLYITCVAIKATTTPAAAARLVLMYIVEISRMSAAEPIASCEPPLNPNQPSHKMKVPRVARGKLDPGMGLIFPSLAYFPVLAPRIMAPLSAAQPPTECTIVEPAKSEKPISLSQPPPQVQEPWMGYIIPVNTTAKIRNAHNLMRSASAPDTIEHVAATNTIWKNQSEPAE